MTIRTRRIAVVACVAAMLPLLSGCMGGDGGSKAGGASGPVTLRIGTDDPGGEPANDQIRELARRVEDLSGGELRIEPVWRAAGRNVSDWDQRVARMVMSGELEMGLIPSRTWDTEGVTSLRALNAPFLITSDELVAEVISGELAREMLSGLDAAGVVGLALFPEGLRHPFGFKKPLLGPEDYAGETIRAPTSKTTSAMFAALGAETTDRQPENEAHAGMESSYLQRQYGTVTGNVTFYPKTNTLVANEVVFEDLDAEQREILERAAVATRRWAIRSTPSDARAARAHCERGRTTVLASEHDLAALEQAAAPVYAELERDARTRSLIERIRRLKRRIAVSGNAPTACGTVEALANPDTPAEEQAQLDGVYRFDITDEELRAAGVTDPQEILQNHGIHTFTLSGGEWCFKQRAPNPLNHPSECSTYEVDGDRLTMYWSVGPPDVLRWRRTSGGDLKLTLLRGPPGEELLATRALYANTWERIGDAE